MTLQLSTDRSQAIPPPTDPLIEILSDAVRAVCAGNLDDATAALARDSTVTLRDAACLNLLGVVCQMKQRWENARRFYAKAMRADRRYAPAEQNMRRLYELYTFGKTNLPLALADHATMHRIRGSTGHRTDRTRHSVERVSLWIRADETMDNVKRLWNPLDYTYAIGAVALATLVGWPLVHSSLHLADSNVLMLYLLSVLWIATRFSRGAAVVASVLGVAVFDFVFVKPYYTFAVADKQYLVTFAAMLLTALVISTLTHRVRLQSELARQAWERVETEFLRNTLLSGVSHELRTPLASITGAASSLRERHESLDPPARAELLDIVCSESERMNRLINNLLDMTRLEAGGLSTQRDWLALEEIIGSALRHLHSRLGDRAVRIDLPPTVPLLHVDGVLIEQVITNVIDNILEYTPGGSPIDISARVSEADVRVTIADHGPGLPPGTEARVFEKFFRAHGSPDTGNMSEHRRGIGLGLAIVRGIIEAHGGRVQARNRTDGTGAIFEFTIPRDGSPPVLDSTQ